MPDEKAQKLFTEAQVKSINDFQHAGIFHPFTCDNSECRGKEPNFGTLIATVDGLTCPTCDYKQNWVHSFMADDSWRNHDWRQKGLFNKETTDADRPSDNDGRG